MQQRQAYGVPLDQSHQAATIKNPELKTSRIFGQLFSQNSLEYFKVPPSSAGQVQINKDGLAVYDPRPIDRTVITFASLEKAEEEGAGDASSMISLVKGALSAAAQASRNQLAHVGIKADQHKMYDNAFAEQPTNGAARVFLASLKGAVNGEGNLMKEMLYNYGISNGTGAGVANIDALKRAAAQQYPDGVRIAHDDVDKTAFVRRSAADKIRFQRHRPNYHHIRASDALSKIRGVADQFRSLNGFKAPMKASSRF